jgi:hypothetical protein
MRSSCQQAKASPKIPTTLKNGGIDTVDGLAQVPEAMLGATKIVITFPILFVHSNIVSVVDSKHLHGFHIDNHKACS